MKRSLAVPVVAALFALNLASGSTQDPAEAVPFNFGDLSSAEDEALELDVIEPEGTEYLFRAQTPEQLQDHETRRVQIVVHKSMKARGYQYMTVSVDGVVLLDLPVSTAWERTAAAKTKTYQAYTPTGKFLPDGMQPKRFSNTWQVWLQYVIRFSGGIWIHATTPDHFTEIGSPASGGCVRLHLSDAERLYELVNGFGMENTAITVLAADEDEKQVPWKHQTRKAPLELSQWRFMNNVRP